MKLLVYNIAYGTGSPGKTYKRLFTSHRYLRTKHAYFDNIAAFIKSHRPDIIGLVEADSGSFRTGNVDQVKELARRLEHYHLCESKYGLNSPPRHLPFLKNHVNAILSKEKENHSAFHFFDNGMKKLIIEAEIEGIVFFLVHLSLRRNVRAKQLIQLTELLPRNRPIIVAGDFNTYGGEKELCALKNHHHLCNPNHDNIPTYPSWQPRHQLDYVLCSHSLVVENFSVPDLAYSDHLPLIVEFSDS